MDSFSDLGAAASEASAGLLRELIAYLPRVGGALALLLLGWVVARVMRAAVMRAARLIDRALRRLARQKTAEREPPSETSLRILGAVVFWGTWLLFLAAATHVLALDAFSGWLGRMAAHLPTVIVGGLIILVGVPLGALVRDLVASAATALEQPQRRLLGRLAQAAVVATAVLVGADQIGIEVTFLVILATVMVGTLLGGVALGLGLGARELFSNLLGAHALRHTYRISQTVQLSGFRGRILEITGTGVVLETDEGRVTLPGKVFHEHPSVLVLLDEDGDE